MNYQPKNVDPKKSTHDLRPTQFATFEGNDIMSWVKHAKEALAKGESVQIKPRGHSMKGKVNDGDKVTLEPCDPKKLEVGDIVLVRCKGTDYLHLIKAIDRERFLIGNNRGGINGWVGANSIYGKAVKIEAS